MCQDERPPENDPDSAPPAVRDLAAWLKSLPPGGTMQFVTADGEIYDMKGNLVGREAPKQKPPEPPTEKLSACAATI